MNKILKAILSILVITAVLSSSIIQFHHHSHDGKIHVLGLELAAGCHFLGFGDVNDGDTACTCASHERHSAHNHDNCSLKLSSVDSPSQFNFNSQHSSSLMAFLQCFLLEQFYNFECQLSNTSIKLPLWDEIILQQSRPDASGLRAPPRHSLARI